MAHERSAETAQVGIGSRRLSEEPLCEIVLILRMGGEGTCAGKRLRPLAQELTAALRLQLSKAVEIHVSGVWSRGRTGAATDALSRADDVSRREPGRRRVHRPARDWSRNLSEVPRRSPKTASGSGGAERAEP